MQITSPTNSSQRDLQKRPRSTSVGSAANTVSTTTSTSVASSQNAAVDAQVHRLLQQQTACSHSSIASNSDTRMVIDESVGPYITSLLRTAELGHADAVTTLTEYESLVEFLQDQCGGISEMEAKEVLTKIAQAVCAPPPESSSSGGLYAGMTLDSFPVLSDLAQTLPPSPSTVTKTVSRGLITTEQEAHAPSPMKPNNLIPNDLMGALDDSSSPHQNRQFMPHLHHQSPGISRRAPTPKIDTNNDKSESFLALTPHKQEEEFPPLSATKTISSSTKATPGSSKKSGRKKKSPRTSSHADNKELAAALFHPTTRARQTSDYADVGISGSSSLGAHSTAASPLHLSLPPSSGPPLSNLLLNNDDIGHNQHISSGFISPFQVDACVHMLLQMNLDLSEEAARAATHLAEADCNVGQFLVDSALRAPPICRHLMNGGCYRSDCQFSHDVEGHTCLFWLRGRCRQSAAQGCPFLHGFHPKLLEHLPSAEYDQHDDPGHRTLLSAPPNDYCQLAPCRHSGS